MDSNTPKKENKFLKLLRTPEEKADKYIWAVYIFLCIVSLIEIYSASSREVTASNTFAPFNRHAVMLAGGTLIVICLSRIHYKYFKMAIPVFVIASVIAMIYVLINGDIINGARRCFTVVGIQIQTSEFIKLSAVLSIALIMSASQMKRGVTNNGVIFSAGLVIAFGGLLFSQGLTNTLLLMAVSLSMMLIAGVQWKKFLYVLIFYGLVGLGAAFYKGIVSIGGDGQGEETEMVETSSATENADPTDRTGTWSNRWDRWLNDTLPLYKQDITPENRQEMYGYMAQANGGIVGVLPGNSRETSRLPLAFSDYIYSIIVEDWGFVGGILLLFAYLSLIARAGNLASKCRRAFPALLILGMAVIITFQALFHMAIVTGVFPVSGQPLPLISKGGSSMLVTAIEFGIMLSVSRFAIHNESHEDIRHDSESLSADNPARLK